MGSDCISSWSLLIFLLSMHLLMFDKFKTSNCVAQMATELYKYTFSVVCHFPFPKMFCFFNESGFACYK